LRLSWRKVKRGMTDTQIADVLGPPSHDTRINGKRVWYYYYPGVGAGSVFFNSDGRVSSDQAPSIGIW
jgi:outer membrane protein assembly factor BamE (lipoprotein component of BamABCDE complex)